MEGNKMYLVECSYLLDSFVTPWKVVLIEPSQKLPKETYRLATDEQVIALIKSYKEVYGDKLILSEHVYIAGNRLDFAHIFD